MSTVRTGRPDPVALVTGGAGGIGSATAGAFLARGYRVSLCDIDEAAAQRLAGRLDRTGERVVAFGTDVASTPSVERAVAGSFERFGRLDALVNLAGGIDPRASSAVGDEEWARLIDVHLGGAFRCARAAFADLARSGAGSIVNVSSIAARTALSLRASYCAAKAGIEGMTRSLALEWASEGIRVNAVAPGHIGTPATERALQSGAISPEVLEARTRRIPAGRYGRAEEIAAVIAFLSGAESSYITGAVICVDGGITINGDAP